MAKSTDPKTVPEDAITDERYEVKFINLRDIANHNEYACYIGRER